MPRKEKQQYNSYMKEYLRLKRKQKYAESEGLTTDICFVNHTPERINNPQLTLVHNQILEISDLRYEKTME